MYMTCIARYYVYAVVFIRFNWKKSGVEWFIMHDVDARILEQRHTHNENNPSSAIIALPVRRKNKHVNKLYLFCHPWTFIV